MNAQELHLAVLDYTTQHPKARLDPERLQAHAQALLDGGHPTDHLIPAAHRLYQHAQDMPAAHYPQAVEIFVEPFRASTRPINAYELHLAVLDYTARNPESRLNPVELHAHARTLLGSGHPTHHLLPSAHRLYQQAHRNPDGSYAQAVRALVASSGGTPAEHPLPAGWPYLDASDYTRLRDALLACLPAEIARRDDVTWTAQQVVHSETLTAERLTAFMDRFGAREVIGLDDALTISREYSTDPLENEALRRYFATHRPAPADVDAASDAYTRAHGLPHGSPEARRAVAAQFPTQSDIQQARAAYRSGTLPRPYGLDVSVTTDELEAAWINLSRFRDEHTWESTVYALRLLRSVPRESGLRNPLLLREAERACVDAVLRGDRAVCLPSVTLILASNMLACAYGGQQQGRAQAQAEAALPVTPLTPAAAPEGAQADPSGWYLFGDNPDPLYRRESDARREALRGAPISGPYDTEAQARAAFLTLDVDA